MTTRTNFGYDPAIAPLLPVARATGQNVANSREKVEYRYRQPEMWYDLRAGPHQSLVDLEEQLADRLLDFERLDEAWPHVPYVLDRARIGQQRDDTLSEISRLQQRIVTAQAVTIEDAAVQLRRLKVWMGTRDTVSERLLASVLAVVEREANVVNLGNPRHPLDTRHNQADNT